MIRKIHLLLKQLDDLLQLPYGTCKIAVKEHLKIESISKLNHEELSYLLRYIDNILLENGIDYDSTDKK